MGGSEEDNCGIEAVARHPSLNDGFSLFLPILSRNWKITHLI
jgi:hypothetical protein